MLSSLVRQISKKLLVASLSVFFVCPIGIILHAQPPFNITQNTISSKRQGEQKICLTMIVKNESRIMERCLDSVKDIVDYISICDTGSTDNTVEIIENFLERTGIPGKVHHHNWVNFGHNRSLSITAAQEFLAGSGFSLPNTYLLFLDADMCFIICPEFDKKTLLADHYLIEQRNDFHSYYNTRLVRASYPWKCIGVTHEYYGSNIPTSQAPLSTLWINDIGDGGCKSDKFERDIRLLTQGLKEEPDNVRYMFYLAQSYHCINNNEESIKWYKARIAAGGWIEEVWYSKFQIGKSYENMGQWDEALKWYLDAFESDPTRAEPLEKIATYYRTHNQNYLAYLFAKQGKEISYPKDHLLFIELPTYQYRFDEELSIAAYYTPHREEGFEATNRLVINRQAPKHTKNWAYQNMVFYVHNIPNTTFKPLKFELPMVREDLHLPYLATNPSIIKTEEGYAVICKTVNYTQKRAEIYTPIDPSIKNIYGNVKTKSILLNYTKDFNLISQDEIIDNLSKKQRVSMESGICDIEDCRIFATDPLQFTCTVFDMTTESRVQIASCRATDTSISSSLDLEELTLLKGPDSTRVEKNWLPFIQNNTLHVIYSYDPFIIYSVDENTGATKESVKYSPDYDFSSFRGSAGPIPFDDGYLAVVHEVVFKEGRIYLHRFLYLDQDFKVTKISKPFTYKHIGIEFCCGMTLDHSNKKLLMGIGIEDAEALIATVDLDTVRSMLQPLNEK